MDFRKIIWTFIILLAFPTLSRAEQKVFTQTVRVVMGSRETQEEVREYATLEAKRQVLEQVGVYLEGHTDLRQHIRESADMLSSETEQKKEIIAVTAGVTQTEITGEEWKSEGGALVLYLTCQITVDSDDVNRKVAALINDRQKLDDNRGLQDDVRRLQMEMEELRTGLEKATQKQIVEIKRQRQRLINERSAMEWFWKGNEGYTWDEKIKYYNYAIKLNPNFARAYNHRGVAYAGKSEYNRAIADFSRAIQINPNDAIAYFNRGSTYKDIGDRINARMDFKKAKELGGPDIQPEIQKRLDELRE